MDGDVNGVIVAKIIEGCFFSEKQPLFLWGVLSAKKIIVISLIVVISSVMQERRIYFLEKVLFCGAIIAKEGRVA
jgi:hypothetical protein